MNHVEFTNDIDQKDYLPINGTTNYFYGKTRRKSVNKTDNLRMCDYIHVKSTNFNSLQICIGNTTFLFIPIVIFSIQVSKNNKNSCVLFIKFS